MMGDWNLLENKHFGEIGMVIGNGPSLKDVPLDFLRKYSSFGTNRIYLLDGFTPTYYVAVNPLVIEQSIEKIFYLDSSALFLREFSGPFMSNEGIYPLHSFSVPMFSTMPQKGVYEGFTVTYVCLQLAYYMGFATAALVGVDHKYNFEGRPNQEMVAEGPDPNHFHPTYFSGGTRWNNPDLAASERSYHMAKTVYEAAGRRIVNLTPGTALDVFEKGTINSWT